MRKHCDFCNISVTPTNWSKHTGSQAHQERVERQSRLMESSQRRIDQGDDVYDHYMGGFAGGHGRKSYNHDSDEDDYHPGALIRMHKPASVWSFVQWVAVVAGFTCAIIFLLSLMFGYNPVFHVAERLVDFKNLQERLEVSRDERMFTQVRNLVEQGRDPETIYVKLSKQLADKSSAKLSTSYDEVVEYALEKLPVLHGHFNTEYVKLFSSYKLQDAYIDIIRGEGPEQAEISAKRLDAKTISFVRLLKNRVQHIATEQQAAALAAAAAPAAGAPPAPPAGARVRRAAGAAGVAAAAAAAAAAAGAPPPPPPPPHVAIIEELQELTIQAFRSLEEQFAAAMRVLPVPV